jgi:AcrR family transcriptional regulator
VADSGRSKAAKRRDGRSAEVRGTAREKLLDSAARVFAERGYGATTADLVAAEAGVTKGALYWHFKNKEELFLALIDERVDRGLRALAQFTQTAAPDGETAEAAGRGLTATVAEERRLILLTHEYWSLAVRDPRLLRRYVARRRALREALAGAVRSRLDRAGVPLTVPADKLATAILGLAGGLSLERVADPEAAPPELLGETLALIYDGLAQRAGTSDRTTPARLRSAAPARRPDALHTLYARRVNARKLPALLELYEPDAIFISPDGQRAQGQEAMRELLGPMLAMRPRLQMSTRYAVTSGDIALLSNDWQVSFSERRPSAIGQKGTGTEIARRQPNGDWLYVLDAPNGID